MQKNGGRRKEGKNVIVRRLDTKMPADPARTDDILRRIRYLKLFAGFPEN